MKLLALRQTRRILQVTALGIAVFIGPNVVQADIFKCMDEAGHVRYSNRKEGPDCNGLSNDANPADGGQSAGPPRTSGVKPRKPPQARQPTNPNPSESKEAFGSGFIVGDGNVVVTNAHVTGRCNQIRVRFGDLVARGDLVAVNSDDDLAVIRVQALKGMPAALRTDEPRIGEPVMVAGYPLAGLLSSDIIVSTGIVSATAGLRGDKSRLQTSAPVQPGNSGGPLIDDKGNVLGIVVSKLNALQVAALTGDVPQNINFAIKSTRLAEFLTRNGIASKQTPRSLKLESEKLAQTAKDYTVQVVCQR